MNMNIKQLYSTPCAESILIQMEQTVAISYNATDRTETLRYDEDEEDL